MLIVKNLENIFFALILLQSQYSVATVLTQVPPADSLRPLTRFALLTPRHAHFPGLLKTQYTFLLAA